MLVNVDSVLFHGLDTAKVQVEVNVSSRGLPSFDIVGLGGRSVEESRHRIKAAIQNSGFEFPNRKITVNLAPADMSKEGSFYDLPICISILSSILKFSIPEKTLFFGELSLSGEVKHSNGIFLMSIFARENKYGKLFISVDSVYEAKQAVKEEVKVFGIRTVKELADHLLGKRRAVEFEGVTSDGQANGSTTESKPDSNYNGGFNAILGQEKLKRALVIGASGGHNTMLIGPPGSGKSMSAKAIVDLLPPLIEEESIEVTKIYSLAGVLKKEQGLITQRPFRQPHHTTSYAGLIGGGNIPMPGEVTFAHRGVLFLDEFSEFNRNVIEALRQPMESGSVTISRSRGSVTYPAKFILIAASNPCPCGYFGDPFHECRCPQTRIDQYRKKMSGPIMDRIDLNVNVKPVENDKIISGLKSGSGNTLNYVRNLIIRARKIQEGRFSKEGIITNSEMSNEQVYKYCNLENSASLLLSGALAKFNFSARSYFKIIKISRTIADLEGSEMIKQDHVAEAIQYKNGP